MKRLMVVAAGTGGHVMPGLAVAGELQRRGWSVSWLGTSRGMERSLVEPHGIAFRAIDFSSLRGKGLRTLVFGGFLLLRAIWQSRRIIRSDRPDAVFSTGGYVAVPAGMAASSLGVPVVLLNPDAAPLMSTKLLAPLVSGVLCGFDGEAAKKAGDKGLVTGNPVRPEIAGVAPPERRYAGREGKARLLVFGGSQGAARLNAVVPAALAELPESLRPDVLHQTGARGVDETVAAYRSRGIEADVRAFIDDMAGAYGWADLAVCRSGALTVAELAAAGVPAVLVPFPAAVDDHQTKNARYVVGAGAAVLMPESELTPMSLAARLRELLESGRPRLLQMALAARATAITDADQRLADACVAAAGGAS